MGYDFWLEYKGEIDDVRIYERALSDSEIQELYNGCSCSGITQADLDAAKQAGRQECINDPASCGIVTNGGSSTCITINPDLSFNIPCAVYDNPLTGTFNLDVTFDYFGKDGDNLLWQLGTVK